MLDMEVQHKYQFESIYIAGELAYSCWLFNHNNLVAKQFSMYVLYQEIRLSDFFYLRYSTPIRICFLETLCIFQQNNSLIKQEYETKKHLI